MFGLTKVWRNAALPAIDPPIARTGEVAEWSNVPDSKSGVGANPPWVRIPPSPPLVKCLLVFPTTTLKFPQFSPQRLLS